MYVGNETKPPVGFNVLRFVNLRFAITCAGLLCYYQCVSQRLSRPNRTPVRSNYGQMACLAQCFLQKGCIYATKSKLCRILEYVPHDPPPKKWSACADIAFPRQILPSKIAGACADHYCGELGYCQPQTSGGYTCVSVGHFSPCLLTSDCGDRHMQCNQGRHCICKEGYGYNVTEDVCSRTCSRSGPGFDGVYGLAIADNSEAKTSSFEDCKKECIRIGCKAIGLNGGECSLHLRGYYEVPERFRIRGRRGVVLYVRRCK